MQQNHKTLSNYLYKYFFEVHIKRQITESSQPGTNIIQGLRILCLQ